MEFESHEAGVLSPDGTDMYVTTQGSGDTTAAERDERDGRRKECSAVLILHSCSTQKHTAIMVTAQDQDKGIGSI